MQEHLAKAQKEMKGKNFTLDRYGIPVAIGKVDSNHLPAFSTPLDTAIKSHDTSVAESTNKKDDKKKKQFVRVAGSRTVDQSSFQPTLSLATTLSGVQTIPRLNPGVVVRSKAAERSGDEIEEDPKHMSMKTYLSRTSLNGKSTGSLQDSSFVGARVGEAGFSQSRTNGLGSTNSLMSNTRSIESIPDVDALEGSRRVVFESQLHDVSDRDLGLGPTTSVGSPPKSTLPKKLSQTQKVTMGLARGPRPYQ
jgi:hypothetical protein